MSQLGNVDPYSQFNLGGQPSGRQPAPYTYPPPNYPSADDYQPQAPGQVISPQDAQFLQGHQPPPQQPLPPVPLSWTKNDEMALARANQDLGLANQMLDDGHIDEGEHQQAMRQIMPRLTKLQQRQQAEMAKAAQQAQQQMMQQQSMAEAMQLEGVKFRARAFRDSVAEWTNPVTGETEHFYPADSKGSWKPIEYTAERRREEAMHIEQGTADPSIAYPPARVGPSGDAVQAGVIGAVGGAIGQAQQAQQERQTMPPPDNLQDFQALPADSLNQLKEESAQTGKPIPLDQFGKAVQQGAGSPTPRILNAFGQEIGSPGATRRGSRDELGRPVPETTDNVLAELHQRAERAIPQAPPDNPHLQLHRADLVSKLTQQMLSRHLGAQEHREQMQRVAAEHRTQETARAQEHRTQEENKAKEARLKEQERQDRKKDLSQKERSDLIKHYEDVVAKEHGEFMAAVGKGASVEEVAKKLGRPLLKSPEARQEEVLRRLRSHEAIRGGGEGLPPVPGPADDRAKGQSAAAAALHEKVFGAPPARSELTPDALARPSNVSAARVKELVPILEAGLKPFTAKQMMGFDTKAYPVYEAMASMSEILGDAHDADRGLTNEEAIKYKQLHAFVHDKLRAHGGAGKLALLGGQ